MGELISRVKGKIKKMAGRITGNKRLEREGKLDEARGRVKGATKGVKRSVKRAVKR